MGVFGVRVVLGSEGSVVVVCIASLAQTDMLSHDVRLCVSGCCCLVVVLLLTVSVRYLVSSLFWHHGCLVYKAMFATSMTLLFDATYLSRSRGNQRGSS
jgi:hypothetical protein